MTRVAVLTPPGSSAVAVLGVYGPQAWSVIQQLFRTPKGEPLTAPPTGFRFGRFGGEQADEVILTSHGPDAFEIHTHGGRQVVEWLLGELQTHGFVVLPWESDFGFIPASYAGQASRLIPFARTVRTASILLDQVEGAYDRAVTLIKDGGPDAEATREVLNRNARVGRHLIAPWKVVIAGAPNAGKSSLLNALAGFDRSIVSPIPGTTRDAVSVSLAFDGWPVDVFDTAGLRDAPTELEREGVGRARAAMADSDLVVWVIDATGPRGLPESNALVVFNKMDLAQVPDEEAPTAVGVSAVSGEGISTLIERIVRALVPDPPRPGDPVPFTIEMCERWGKTRLE